MKIPLITTHQHRVKYAWQLSATPVMIGPLMAEFPTLICESLRTRMLDETSSRFVVRCEIKSVFFFPKLSKLIISNSTRGLKTKPHLLLHIFLDISRGPQHGNHEPQPPSPHHPTHTPHPHTPHPHPTHLPPTPTHPPTPRKCN